MLQLPAGGNATHSFVALSAVNASSASQPDGRLVVLGGSRDAAAVQASAAAAAPAGADPDHERGALNS